MRQAIHGKSRIRYESKCVGVRNGHPSRQQHQCAIRLPDDEMLFATVLLAAENTHSVTVSRMKRVEDLHLKTQTPGIMTLARAAPAKHILPSPSPEVIRAGARGRFFNVVDLVNRLETETRGRRAVSPII